MKRAGDILKASGELERRDISVISKRLAKRIEGVELVREARDAGQQEIGFNSRPFVLCGLPIRRPAAGVREYSRRNGRVSMRINSNSSLGLPFGQDRLIPLWVSTLAVRQQSRRVTFGSAAELLREFGLSTAGFHYKRMMQGFERIFDATITFQTDGTRGAARYVEKSRVHYFDKMRLWYLDDSPGLPGEDFQNVIELSEPFWQEIQAHPIPVDMRIVRALAHASGQLDFACWLIWRCHTAKAEQSIPLTGENGLQSQMGVMDYTRPRRFRQQIAKWLDVLRGLWPECPAELKGEFLVIRPAQAIRPRLSKV